MASTEERGERGGGLGVGVGVTSFPSCPIADAMVDARAAGMDGVVPWPWPWSWGGAVHVPISMPVPFPVSTSRPSGARGIETANPADHAGKDAYRACRDTDTTEGGTLPSAFREVVEIPVSVVLAVVVVVAGGGICVANAFWCCWSTHAASRTNVRFGRVKSIGELKVRACLDDVPSRARLPSSCPGYCWYCWCRS